MADFRLLHISDLHLSRQPNRHNIQTSSQSKAGFLRTLFKHPGSSFYPATFDQDLAESVARFAYNRRNAIDTILITGDIATTGLKEDLKPAFRYVDDPAVGTWLAKGDFPTLQGANRKICLIPGNHDRYESNSGNAGGTNFDAIFSKYWPSTSPVQSTVFAKSGDTHLGIITVDFTLAKNADATKAPLAKLGQGRAYPNRIAQLEQATIQAKAKYKNIAIIWAMHFPPEYSASSRSLQLCDGDKVTQAASRQEIPLILAGHQHEKLDYKVQGTQIICAGTSASLDRNKGNTLHELTFSLASGARLTWKCEDYAWDQDTCTFVAV